MKPEGQEALSELYNRMYETEGVHTPDVGEAMGKVFDNLEVGESLDIQFASRQNEGVWSIQVGATNQIRK